MKRIAAALAALGLLIAGACGSADKSANDDKVAYDSIKQACDLYDVDDVSKITSLDLVDENPVESGDSTICTWRFEGWKRFDAKGVTMQIAKADDEADAISKGQAVIDAFKLTELDGRDQRTWWASFRGEGDDLSVQSFVIDGPFGVLVNCTTAPEAGDDAENLRDSCALKLAEITLARLS